jgi:hypothetical protein
MRIEWRDKPAAPRCSTSCGWSASKPTPALKLGVQGNPLDVESTLASQQKLTAQEVRLGATIFIFSPRLLALSFDDTPSCEQLERHRNCRLVLKHAGPTYCTSASTDAPEPLRLDSTRSFSS